ncbi:MAG: type III-B CRISPR-associated protein Cas10/Cmr2 [Aquificota bacterium]|nr:type III-B CRISPR-associated protein Cas10/Cmr2 [Aquificota bacterium]
MSYLLIFTFSPVQGFITTSRRTRDLFTASFILSHLTQTLLENLVQKGVRVIYPSKDKDKSGFKEALANFPNKLVAIVEDEEIYVKN